MDPVTGTFTSMDTYAGSLSDPMSLHKYLFANSNPVMYSDPSGHESLTECNTTVAIITILAEVSTGILYYMIGDINGADKTKPGFWIGMFVAMILAAFLAYFAAGAFVAGVAICLFGKILLGLMGIIAGGILYKLSNTARVKGYNTYADLFEFASVLLQSYAFGELLEGIAEGFQTLKDKVKNAKPQMLNKRGGINFGANSTKVNQGGSNSSGEIVYPNEKTYESARRTLLSELDKTGAFESGGNKYIGRLNSSYGNGKQIGMQSLNRKVTWRLDYDNKIGVHFNIEDYSYGKGNKAIKKVIPIDISYEEYKRIIDSWNK